MSISQKVELLLLGPTTERLKMQEIAQRIEENAPHFGTIQQAIGTFLGKNSSFIEKMKWLVVDPMKQSVVEVVDENLCETSIRLRYKNDQRILLLIPRHAFAA